MKIYTKVGDGGNTFLFGGGKVRKDHPRVMAYGDVDELNSILGWAETLTKKGPLSRAILEVQRELFVLGADLSTPVGSRPPKPVPRIGATHIERLEKEIDELSAALPELKNFILPGGSALGSILHLARAVVRRAERSLVALLEKERSLSQAQIYLNRLSDYLFVLARTANRRARRSETVWK